MYFSDHKWKYILLSQNPVLNDFKFYGTNIPPGTLINNLFWKNVFSAYKDFGNKLSAKEQESFLAEPLYFNPIFQLNKATFFFCKLDRKRCVFC